MGRYDFRAHRVLQAATQQLATARLSKSPPWYNVVGSIPPPQILVRTQPIEHHDHPRRPQIKKPSKLFQPRTIKYEEDLLRAEFFRDHPWELARPRVVLENDGKDGQRDDWSTIEQESHSLNGESVVQRQMWLLHNRPNITKAEAYDQARHEFYERRLQEDVERRVAKEEALATGAYFGKSTLQVGMELEDRMFERWKEWAVKETTEQAQKEAAAYTSVSNEDMVISGDDSETEAAMADVDDSIPAQGQEAAGSMPVHP